VSGHPTVLVVDDERDIADTYAAMLGESYDVRVAYGGEAALDAIDDDVDAVLLDRRMPDVSGDVVLERVREAGYGCKVIMVTAIDPDLDILAMDFDDYLSKPIKRDTLVQAVDQQLDFIHDPNRKLDEFFKLVSTLEVLEERLPAERGRPFRLPVSPSPTRGGRSRGDTPETTPFSINIDFLEPTD
jgi:DNA-binding response OmpR family regulator